MMTPVPWAPPTDIIDAKMIEAYRAGWEHHRPFRLRIPEVLEVYKVALLVDQVVGKDKEEGGDGYILMVEVVMIGEGRV